MGYFLVPPSMMLAVSNSGPKIPLVSWEDLEDVGDQWQYYPMMTKNSVFVSGPA